MRLENQIVLLLILVGGGILIQFTGNIALILDIAILILGFLIFKTLRKVLNNQKEIIKSQTELFDLIYNDKKGN
jgi:hypothetical protein